MIFILTPKEGETILSQELTLMIDGSRYVNPKVKASMTITDLEANSSEEALAKMSEWCRRMSEALAKAYKSKMVSLPI